jgi:hypothetical protein
MTELRPLFEALATPPRDSGAGMVVAGIRVPGISGHRLAKDSDGNPVLLIATVGESVQMLGTPPIRLENITIEHSIPCKIWHDEGPTEEGIFTIVRCLASEVAVRTYFLQVALPLLAVLNTNPSAQRVSLLFNGLAQLFRALAEPPLRSVRGLWAELFLITNAHDSVALAQAWHPGPEERYDFSAGADRVEVKSAIGRVRRHHFSLDQLSAATGTSLVVASLYVEPSGGGATIGAFLGRLRRQLVDRADLLLDIQATVAKTLGQTLPLAMEEGFDEELASSSLAFFAGGEIPRPSTPLPAGVSDVRFVADLTGLVPISLNQVKGELFRSIKAR